MRLFNFSKMHGLENDFVIFNNLKNEIFLTKKIINKLSNRNIGIGFDQLILVENSYEDNVDFFYKIFNADGNEIFQCINGARCFGRFVFLKNIVDKKNICIRTKNKKMFLENIDKDFISIKLPKPDFDPINIPFLKEYSKHGYNVRFESKNIKFFIVFLGNPHCVIFLNNVFNIKINKIGYFLENHFLFPKGVNVNFVEIVSNNEINVRTYERGVGETRSCGSGVSASAVVGINNGFINNEVFVNVLGGKMHVYWGGKDSCIILKGDVKHVFDGVINLQNF
ncbi:diaminopimelate epimerase [Buchnera aphidicola (Ceratoglyphina bambusae)]|uniref:diaminopimelate epimerase n=1 Tax=Buchnera aphidicola TaxID=9 RepID=UPI0031B87CE9